MRPRFLLSLLGLGLLASTASAQAPATQFGFVFGSTAKILQGADTLSQAWVGGLNTPQFSGIDLNGDGQTDLYAFDRETARSYTFLNVAKATGGRRYQYAPEYERIFPSDLQSWVQLRDYDCDGRLDLFTRADNSDIRVFHNVADGTGAASFVLANNQLTYPYGTYNININTGYCNVPSIQDVNGDGRLDIVTPDFISGSYLEVYLNTSTGSCGGISSFSLATNYWGQLSSCLTTCAGYQLNGAACQAFLRLNHCAGYVPLLLDLNGDGKLDLLEGRDNCPQLSRLINSGASTVAAAFVPADVNTAFPSASSPVNLSMFPAPTLLDVTFDGVPEMLVAPAMLENSQDFVSMRHNILQYKNTSTSTLPNFTFVTNSFLQSDMLDVSEGAAPTFGDLDGDGLTDMLVGNRGDLVNGYYRASLSYYRNVGSAHKPVFQLVTDDYLGLAATAALTPTVGFQTLLPQLVDINRDGALDLVYSAYQTYPYTGSNPTPPTNFLYYLVNKAAAGQAVAFNAGTVSSFKPQGAAGTGVLPSLHYDAPCFFDVDNDGYVDMLLGTNAGPEPGYSLRYFRNQGAKANGNLDNLFVLADNDYGTLRDPNTLDHRFYNLTPLVADFDKDGQPDLLTVDYSATVRLYSNFRTQGASFTARTDLFFNRLTQQFESARLGSQNVYGSFNRFVPATADLNQDGRPELYIGTESGGIVSYLSGPAATMLASQPAAQALGLGLYPNPATSSATLETLLPTRVCLFDLTGRLVQQDATLLRSRVLRLQSLAPGVYLVQATAADGTRATQRLSVQ